MKPREFRENILNFMVSHAADSYKETVRVAAVIEDKAQKVAALAGVFLAVGFSFIKQENLAPESALGGSLTLLLISFSIVTLIACVSCCLWVLWIREQARPIQMPIIHKIVHDVSLLDDDSLTEELQDRSRIEFGILWSNILERQERVNLKKAAGVQTAQVLLSMSIITIASAILLVLLENLGLRMIHYFAR